MATFLRIEMTLRENYIFFVISAIAIFGVINSVCQTYQIKDLQVQIEEERHSRMQLEYECHSDFTTPLSIVEAIIYVPKPL